VGGYGYLCLCPLMELRFCYLFAVEHFPYAVLEFPSVYLFSLSERFIQFVGVRFSNGWGPLRKGGGAANASPPPKVPGVCGSDSDGLRRAIGGLISRMCRSRTDCHSLITLQRCVQTLATAATPEKLRSFL